MAVVGVLVVALVVVVAELGVLAVVAELGVFAVVADTPEARGRWSAVLEVVAERGGGGDLAERAVLLDVGQSGEADRLANAGILHDPHRMRGRSVANRYDDRTKRPDEHGG